MSLNKIMQVNGTFMPEDNLLEITGSLVSIEQRTKAIKDKLEKNGFIKGAYIRPIKFENNELIITEEQVDFLVRDFDHETKLFSIELTTDKPFPEGCEVAIAYECIKTGNYTADVIGIYFAYLNNAEQMPYGHF